MYSTVLDRSMAWLGMRQIPMFLGIKRKIFSIYILGNFCFDLYFAKMLASFKIFYPLNLFRFPPFFILALFSFSTQHDLTWLTCCEGHVQTSQSVQEKPNTNCPLWKPLTHTHPALRLDLITPSPLSSISQWVHSLWTQLVFAFQVEKWLGLQQTPVITIHWCHAFPRSTPIMLHVHCYETCELFNMWLSLAWWMPGKAKTNKSSVQRKPARL